LVFAPESEIAYFGGDPDNFEYPRYDLDVCFFRVYENGKPANTPDYLKWNPESLKEGDLVFIAGNPGRTDRLNTVEHLKYLRDIGLPESLEATRRREVLAQAFGARSDECARRAAGTLQGCQNGRKANSGKLAGLQDPAVMKAKQAEQDALLKAAKAKPGLDKECESAIQAIHKSLQETVRLRAAFGLLEHGRGLQCTTFGIAKTLVRLAEETGKPNEERLREYRESNMESLKQGLFSEAPIYEDWEIEVLADSLSYLLENRTELDAKLVDAVMAGKGPRERAAELIRGTKLADVKVRRQLAEGGLKAIEASKDPMIELALLLDKPAREIRKEYEQKVEEPQRAAYGKLANARFAVLGEDTCPDATFSLRLAYGVVKGYRQDGELLPPWTTLGGAFKYAKEHGSKDPFALPKSWLEHEKDLNLSTPFNFVCTADIIGGNSGSPVVDREGRLVGIIFDGNLPSLVWDYVYSNVEGRAIAVHGSAIFEALQHVYDARALVDELHRE
jgi:hypothetical protein